MPSLNTFKLTLTRPSAVSVSLLENCGVGVSGALNVALLSVTLMYVESKLERPYSSGVHNQRRRTVSRAAEMGEDSPGGSTVREGLGR